MASRSSKALQVGVLIVLAGFRQAAAGSNIASFGDHWIEQIRENNSYILHLLPSKGTTDGFITVQCFHRDVGGTITIGSPDLLRPFQSGFITAVLWSGSSRPHDISFLTWGGGGFAVLATTPSSTPSERHDAQIALETISKATKFLAYSVNGNTTTIDAMHLPAAWTRFGDLCNQERK